MNMDKKYITNKIDTVYSTRWFDLAAKYIDQETDPYYYIQTQDYVSMLATTDENEVVLVKQFRPALDRFTIELPSGHVDEGETPEESARRELLEETGYIADDVTKLCELVPDTGRLGNKLWAYHAKNVKKSDGYVCQEDIVSLKMPIKRLLNEIVNGKFDHALNLAVIFMAFLKEGEFG